MGLIIEGYPFAANIYRGFVMEEYGMSVTFIDKQGREIEIYIEDFWPPEIIAKCHGKIVGRIEFVEFKGTSIILAHVNVDAEYQKSGIASCMLREFMKFNDDFLVPNRLWSAATQHALYYSSEGAAFINSCFRNGILSETNEASY